MEYITLVTSWIGVHTGDIALWIVAFRTLANATPTEWDNKILDAILPKLYMAFSVLGAKVPNIVKVEDGKVVTTTEIKAK